MNRDAIVSRNPQIVARHLAEADGAVLLHLETGAYHGLNQVGLVVWELIDGQRTVADLIEGVRERVADPPSSVDDDVLSFLEGAVARDLVSVA